MEMGLLEKIIVNATMDGDTTVREAGQLYEKLFRIACIQIEKYSSDRLWKLLIEAIEEEGLIKEPWSQIPFSIE